MVGKFEGLDMNVTEAIDLYFEKGIDPGSFGRALLEEDWEQALLTAHEPLSPRSIIAHMNYVKEKRRENDTPEQRIKKAIDVGVKYGGIDGAHHKDWVIDQMIRALTGCPMVQDEAIDSKGEPYSYERQGESDEYNELIREVCDGEDGPNTYHWEVGIVP